MTKPGTQTTPAQATAKKRGAADASPEWRLEPHVCRLCFARIASRPSPHDGQARIYMCTSCGNEAEGSKPDLICSCGTKLRRPSGKLRSFGAPAVDAGIRCQPNPEPRPGFPALYIATYTGK